MRSRSITRIRQRIKRWRDRHEEIRKKTSGRTLSDMDAAVYSGTVSSAGL